LQVILVEVASYGTIPAKLADLLQTAQYHKPIVQHNMRYTSDVA
jgi:hypothetical protein